MSFGKLCTTLLPTLVGDFLIHALPESVEMGQHDGRQVVGLLEHAAITSPNYDPTLPTRIHVIQENVFDDLFVGTRSNEHRRLLELMNMLNERQNEILVVVRSPDTAGLIALKNRAPQPNKITIASANRIIDEVVQRLGIQTVSEIIPQQDMHPTPSVPETITTQYGIFKVKAMDVAEQAVMPAIAWNTLFPNETGVLAEGQQPIVVVHKKHVALIREPLSSDADLPMVRIHSSCFTSMCGSKSCDCGQQFQDALELIAKNKNGGVMLHHDAEGRGAGLALKMLMYELKRNGMSTYQAMHVFGFQDDEREYTAPVQMVREILKDGPFTLITNNMDKVRHLNALGANVVGTARIIAKEIYPEMVDYLDAKRRRSHPGYADALNAKATP